MTGHVHVPIAHPNILFNMREQYHNKLYCLYEHYVLVGRALTRDEIEETQHKPYEPRFAPLGLTKIFIGSCKLQDAFRFKDAARNQTWLSMIRPETDVFVNIIMTGSRYDCLNEQARYVNQCGQHLRPICNRFASANKVLSAGRIVCSDGRIFENQQVAADALEVSQSRISQHLARRTGFKTVRGLTLDYEVRAPQSSVPIPANMPLVPSVPAFPGQPAPPPLPDAAIVPPAPVSPPPAPVLTDAERASAALAALASMTDGPDSPSDME
jgi:hypothetical protein